MAFCLLPAAAVVNARTRHEPALLPESSVAENRAERHPEPATEEQGSACAAVKQLGNREEVMSDSSF